MTPSTPENDDSKELTHNDWEKMEKLPLHKHGDCIHTDFHSCPLPPPGWFCTRPKGHEGPCAAAQIEEIKEFQDKLDEIAIKEEWSTPTQGSWQERFDEKFKVVHISPDPKLHFNSLDPDPEAIKSFITQVLQEQEDLIRQEYARRKQD